MNMRKYLLVDKIVRLLVLDSIFKLRTDSIISREGQNRHIFKDRISKLKISVNF